MQFPKPIQRPTYKMEDVFDHKKMAKMEIISQEELFHSR